MLGIGVREIAMRLVFGLAALAGAVGLAGGHAAAQSFQTALPVSPQERRAIEARLSTILEYAGANEVSTFDLPSGRQVKVRPYRMVRRAGERPCRGYRIDLEGASSRTAVDGFRCKRSDGQAWVIVEPELVLSQEGSPLDLGAEGDPFVASRRDDEPIYPSNDSVAVRTPPPPVPRPAPRRQAALVTGDRVETTAFPVGTLTDPPQFATVDGGDDRPQSPSDDEAAGGPDRVLAAVRPALQPDTAAGSDETAPAQPPVGALDGDEGGATGVGDTPPSPLSADDISTAALEPEPPFGPTQSRLDQSEAPLEGAAPSEDDAPRAVVASAPSRVIGEPIASNSTRWTANDTVVDGLKDLDYLAAGTRPNESNVTAAIDEFASDERFALPISTSALIERLNAAIERSETLPPCASGIASSLCVEQNAGS